MTDMKSVPANPFARFLALGGGVLLVLGTIVGFTAKGAAEKQATADEFTASFSGFLVDVEPDYSGAWVGLVMALVGVALLIVWIAQKSPAVTSQAAP